MRHPTHPVQFVKKLDSKHVYSNFTTIGNSIYVRTRDEQGAPIFVEKKYKPTFFLPADNPDVVHSSETLDGTKLIAHQCGSLKAGREFLEENPEAYGDIQQEYAYIADVYGTADILATQDELYIWNIDIEVDSEHGYAPVDDPFAEVIAITVKWRHRGATGKVVYALKPLKQREGVTYFKCKDEVELLVAFLTHWRDRGDYPDIVTGWNIQFYDIPYLVNRIKRVLKSGSAEKMSPYERLTERRVTLNGRDQIAVDIRGVAILDYYELYRKFTLTQKESYRLDFIAEEELKEKKVDYVSQYGSLHQLYTQNFELFMEYNIQDVELVDKLDQKLKLIELVISLAYNAKANYVDTFRQVRLWDIMIYHHLRGLNIQIPPRKEVDKNEQFAGAFVKEPQVGQHKWIVSFDVASMYPHIIRQWNLSPETILEPKKAQLPDIDTLLSESPIAKLEVSKATGQFERQELFGDNQPIDPLTDACVAANGLRTRRDIEGFLPKMLKVLYEERKRFANLMKDMDFELSKLPERKDSMSAEDYAAEKQRMTKLKAAYNNQQAIRKVNLNSAYGALGSNYFRFFDVDMAEAVTLSGQLTIQLIAKDVNAFLNKIFKTKNEDFIIASDTDSIYVRLEKLADIFQSKKPNASTKEIALMMKEFGDAQLQPLINKTFERLATYLNVANPCMSMAREVIADKGVWTAKKRYMMNVLIKDKTESFEEPKLFVKGIETQRSSTPAYAKKILKRGIELMLRGTELELQTHITKSRDEFMKAGFVQIAMPRSVNGLRKYEHAEKGVPIQVKGALIYNRKLQAEQSSLEQIRDGSKIRFAYLKVPNKFNSHVISAVHECPPEWEIEKILDYDKQFQITVIDPLDSILKNVGWSAEHQDTLF